MSKEEGIREATSRIEATVIHEEDDNIPDVHDDPSWSPESAERFGILPDNIPDPEPIETEEGWELEGELTKGEELELVALLQQFRDVILAHEIRLSQIENMLTELFKAGQKAQKPKMVVPKGR